ncbi:MAG: large subunit ribosomal protein [Thermoplasmata archaeon]|jgi:large subunit ribosomal protein L24|nr:large subunit ribosomal protein [Thermoplasmata archaeon]
MTKNFTTQPRKQRLQRLTAPHHVARKQMASHLSEELLLKYNRRSLTVIKGDEVKLMRGDWKGTSGKVLTIDARFRKVTVDGITNKKADGTEVPLPVDPSNLLIVKLNLEDNRRRSKLEATEESVKMGKDGKKAKQPKAAKPKKAAAKKAKEATQ